MKVLVKYVDFHWDNYQGGSGKSFKFKTIIEVDDMTRAGDIHDVVKSSLLEFLQKQRVFCQGNEMPAIISVEIL